MEEHSVERPSGPTVQATGEAMTQVGDTPVEH